MIGKKGLGKLGTLVIGIVIFSGVILGISNFIGDASTTYNLSNNTNLSSFSRMENMSSRADTMEASVKGGDLSISDAFTVFSKGAYNGIVSLFSLPSVIGSLLTDLSDTQLNLPPWVVTLGITIVTLMIVFTIISALFKHEV